MDDEIKLKVWKIVKDDYAPNRNILISLFILVIMLEISLKLHLFWLKIISTIFIFFILFTIAFITIFSERLKKERRNNYYNILEMLNNFPRKNIQEKEFKKRFRK